MVNFKIKNSLLFLALFASSAASAGWYEGIQGYYGENYANGFTDTGVVNARYFGGEGDYRYHGKPYYEYPFYACKSYLRCDFYGFCSSYQVCN